MNSIITILDEERVRLEKMLKKIDDFLINAPKGSLKWQNKNGKIYYYQQLMIIEDKKNHSRWKRKYIKKKDISLAQALAQKHYYMEIRGLIENKLNQLKNFLEKFQQNDIEEVYNSLSSERKKMVVPLLFCEEEKIKEWQEEVYEKNRMYPEHLRYETEQGDLVRSKSEVIIANILYQNRKDILYKYERPLKVMENGKVKTIYPDFTILNLHTGKVTYWEHAGRMDDSHYANEFVKKMNLYTINNLFPKDVVVTFETQEISLNISAVKRIVNTLL